MRRKGVPGCQLAIRALSGALVRCDKAAGHVCSIRIFFAMFMRERREESHSFMVSASVREAERAKMS